MSINFAEDIKKGFTSVHKYIPDRQFYDDAGSDFFKELMLNKNYYPTNCEYNIFESNKTEICKIFTENNKNIQLVEFGAGDGFKTELLIDELIKQKTIINYFPIDFNEKYLKELQFKLQRKNSKLLNVNYLNKDYFEALNLIENKKGYRKVILFIGSSFGGLDDNESKTFLQKLYNLLNKNDLVLFGIDLKKSPKILHKAYHNTCKAWCYHLLNRVNLELDGDIDLNNFEYYTNYDPISGDYKWYFISKKAQKVNIKKIKLITSFDKSEPIYFSKSKKFSENEIINILERNNFKIYTKYKDKKNYFLNIIFTKK